MTNDKLTHTLARIQLGFRTDAAHLKELEQDLTLTLLCARQFGMKHGTPDAWNASWEQQWDKVEVRLHRLRVLVNEMNDCIEWNDRARFKEALAAWETIQAEDDKLVTSLSAIRVQASELDAVARKEWNLLALKLDLNSEAMHACAQVLRIKLELLKKHSKEEVDQLIQDVDMAPVLASGNVGSLSFS